MRESPPGEMRKTYADTQRAQKLLGYEPKVSVADGMQQLMNWVREYQDLLA